MRPRFITKSSLLLLACAACVSQAHAAGDAAATSGYLTIQPNAGNTGYVYTFSWVAPDTDNDASGTTYTDTRFLQPFGSGNGSIDDVNTGIAGGNYLAPGGQLVRYAWGMSTPGDETVPTNTETVVQWQDPMTYDVGVIGPSVANPRFDGLGNYTNLETFIVGSGIQGVIGVFSTNPNGTGAVTGTGVGFGVDSDGPSGLLAHTDDFSPMLTGYSHILDATPTNPYSNTGYVRVEVPYPTSGADFTTRFNPGTYTDNAAIEVFVTTNPEGTYNAKLALAGDMDSDFDIDNADIGVITGNFTGSVAAGGKFYATGDLTADGDVDNADIGIVTGGFTGSLAGNLTPTVGVPDLKYNPSTGNITVDTEGLAITSFQLENYATGTFNFANYNSPENSSANLFGFTYEQVSGNVIGDSDGLNVGFTGMHDFGNILPTGLTQQQLEAYLQTAFWGTFGAGSGEFDLVVIPEPGAALLGGLSLLTLLRRRRN